MSDIAARLYDAADMATRAAVAQQQAELGGPRADPAIIGGLELAAGMLRYAAQPLSPAPVASRRTTTEVAVLLGVQALVCVAVLSAVPNPSQPLILALTLGASGLPAVLVRDIVAAIWDRYQVRDLVESPAVPGGIEAAVAEVRSRIREITVRGVTSDVDVLVGRRIETALAWLDGAELAAANVPARDAEDGVY